jgi:hypothetical protein
MSDGVYASMQHVQSAPAAAMIDGASAEPKAQQLRSRHHPVLKVGKLGDPPIEGARLHFARYSRVNCSFVRHAVQVD